MGGTRTWKNYHGKDIIFNEAINTNRQNWPWIRIENNTNLSFVYGTSYAVQYPYTWQINSLSKKYYDKGLDSTEAKIMRPCRVEWNKSWEILWIT